MKKITFVIALMLCFTSELWAQKAFFNDMESNLSKKELSLFIFYKPDCPYCVHLRNDFTANPLFQKNLLEKYNVKLIDVTTIDGQQLAIKCKVQSIPFMISYNTKTAEEKRIKGYNSVEKIALFLNLNYTTSLNSKSSNAICGNGILESGEACDDGNVINNDGCQSDCTLTPVIAICGNGILESGEACDDGNVINNDGCQSDCTLTPLSVENSSELLNGIVMFPMPFRDSISIKLLIDLPSDTVIAVCNITGQLLKRQTVPNRNDENKTIEISGLDSLPAGIYLLKIESNTGNFSQVKKIIKQ